MGWGCGDVSRVLCWHHCRTHSISALSAASRPEASKTACALDSSARLSCASSSSRCALSVRGALGGSLEVHLFLRELGHALELRRLARARLRLDRLRSTGVERAWGVGGG